MAYWLSFDLKIIINHSIHNSVKCVLTLELFCSQAKVSVEEDKRSKLLKMRNKKRMCTVPDEMNE